MMNWHFHLLLFFFSTLRYLLIYEFCRLITLVPPDLSKLKWTSWLRLCIYLYHIPDSPHLSGTNVKDTDFLAPFLRTFILPSKARESVSAIIQSDSCDSVIGGCHFPSTLWRSLLGIKSDWQRIWVTLRGKEEWSPCVQVLQLVPLLSDLYPKAADVFFLIKSSYIQMSFLPRVHLSLLKSCFVFKMAILAFGGGGGGVGGNKLLFAKEIEEECFQFSLIEMIS